MRSLRAFGGTGILPVVFVGHRLEARATAIAQIRLTYAFATL
jgi:hypothetical protein